MAEAIVNNIDGINWHAYSAGTQPVGYVHPKALQVLAEIGIQHQGKSKSVDQYRNVPFNLVITICDSAAEECPIWLRQDRVLNHSFPDPAKASGLSSLNVKFVTLERKRRVSPFERRFFTSLRSDQNDKLKFDD